MMYASTGTPTYNESNPILVWHRLAREEDLRLRDVHDAAVSHSWTLEDLNSIVFDLREVGVVTDEHRRHAQRVLTRLIPINERPIVGQNGTAS